MLPPPASTDLTSTPKKILRLSQTKAAIDQAHALEKSVSPVSDDERDEVASNTSVAVSRRWARRSCNLLRLLSLEFIRVPEENLVEYLQCFYVFIPCVFV